MRSTGPLSTRSGLRRSGTRRKLSYGPILPALAVAEVGVKVLAGVLVLLGAATLLTATEVIEDLALAGLFARFCRRVVPTWIRYGILAMVVGAGLIVLGLFLLHIGS